MANTIKTNQLPSINDLTNAYIIGLDKDGKDAKFPITALRATKVGDATPTSSPAAGPLIGQYYDLVGTSKTSGPSGTYVNFPGVGGTPIIIPAPAAGSIIIAPIAWWNGTYWVPSWQERPLTVDLSSYALQTDVLLLKAKTDTISLDGTSGYDFIDSYGYLAGRINNEGKLEMLLTLETFNTNGVAQFSADGTGFEIIDQYGFVVTQVNSSGVDTAKYVAPATDPEPIYDVLHIIRYGQSNAITFTQSAPNPERTSKPDIYTFQKGSKVAGQTDAQLAAIAVDDVSVNYDSVFGWTAASSMARAYKQFIAADNRFSGLPAEVFISAPGQGDTSISNLSKGTTPYTNLLKGVQNAQNWAVANGKTHFVGAIEWMQGERDNTDLLDKDTYKARFKALMSTLNTDIKAITGQTEDIKFIIWQMDSITSQGNFRYSITLALLELATEGNANVYLGPTTYNLPFSDSQHLSAVGAVRSAALSGYMLKRILWDGQANTNIYPLRFDRRLRTIYVKCFLPDDSDTTKLEFDTTNVTLIANYGFNLTDASGNAINILSVSVFRKNIIKITADQDLAAGFVLTYGINGNMSVSGSTSGPRGNVSINQVPAAYASNATTYLIKHYLPIFRTVLK